MRMTVEERLARVLKKEEQRKQREILVENKGDGNPHAHILLTTRPLDCSGRWMDKQRRNYLLDENGERIFDPIKGRYKLGKSIKTHDWDDPDRVQEWRAGWAKVCNVQFRQHGIDKEVTYLSYAKRVSTANPPSIWEQRQGLWRAVAYQLIAVTTTAGS